MPKPEHEFFDAARVPRERVTPAVAGLWERILARDSETGDYTRLLEFEPGCDTSPMGVQRHDFWEEVWIVSGSFRDLTLGQTFRAGMYACRPPGMPHGPWRSAEGCTTFETRYYRKR